MTHSSSHYRRIVPRPQPQGSLSGASELRINNVDVHLLAPSSCRWLCLIARWLLQANKSLAELVARSPLTTKHDKEIWRDPCPERCRAEAYPIPTRLFKSMPATKLHIYHRPTQHDPKIGPVEPVRTIGKPENGKSELFRAVNGSFWSNTAGERFKKEEHVMVSSFEGIVTPAEAEL